MNTTREKKSILLSSPLRLGVALLSALVIAAHLLCRGNYALNAALSRHFVRPVHRALGTLTAKLPFSLAECLLALAALGLIAYLAISLLLLITRGDRLKRLYSVFLTLAAFGLGVYALFCLLWGIYYYGDDFRAQSGLRAKEISTGELSVVTEYFALLANDYAGQVPRDENGVCQSDRREILAQSPQVYEQAQRLFPCLEGPPLPAKGFYFSRLLSYTDFAGFFFPFTAEANVNTDFPPSLFASTVAHELAHQRGVAKEQEANFCAVLSSLLYGDEDYCYSACLLAYTHLGNALYGADRGEWERVSGRLDEAILRDFAANRSYWAQFETPVQTVSNTVYEGFLYSYDQDLGLRSYGACVDLLVNYYYEDALRYLAARA